MCDFFKRFAIVCSVMCCVIFSLIYIGDKSIPDEIITIENSDYKAKSILGLSLFQLNYNDKSNQNSECVFQSKAEIELLNIIPVKTSEITNTKRKYVILGGELFGIKLYTDGVIVVDTTSVLTDKGNINPAEKAGLKKGDIIKSANNTKVNSTKELVNIIESSKGKTIKFEIVRKGKILTIDFSTYKDVETVKYKAGLWVRDSSAGLGTITFYDTDSDLFAGLGHGIYDTDTNQLMPLRKGEVYDAYIKGLYKSENGNIGELCGVISGESKGKLYLNDDIGVYGIFKCSKNQAIPVAMIHEIETGDAKLYCTIDNNGVKEYNIKIKKIFSNSLNKDMIIEITDSKLLEKTGGIVQGMSGSPIVQNGMLVGAVTHVFVNDSTRGYAIFAEDMVETSYKILKNEYDIAS